MANSFQTEWEAPELESLASLAVNIVIRLKGCDDTLIRKTLQEVAREFVADTQCLTTRQPVRPDAGGMCFLVPFFGGIVADVREVWKFGRRLRKGVDWNYPIGSGLRIAPYLLPRADLTASQAASIPMDARRYTPSVNLMDAVPAPSEQTHTPFFAVTVEHLPLFYERLPKEFLHRHGDAICSGVLARLFSMTGNAWSDLQQAAEERVRYENFMSEARMAIETPAGGQAIDTSEVL